MIITKPLTQAQKEALATVSDKQIRDAQDALFMYLLEKVADLESRLQDSPKLKVKNLTK